MFMCATVYKQNSSRRLFFRPFRREIASRYFGGAAKFQSSDRRTWATVHVLPFYKARFLASAAMLACKGTQRSGWTHVVVVSFFFLGATKGRTAGTETNRIHGESQGRRDISEVWLLR